MSEKSIAIIGAGVFGISTALAWRRKHLGASVFLIDMKPVGHESIDRRGIVPASEDTGKIIRTAYSSSNYARLSKEAMEVWETESVYSKYWHKSGWVVANIDEPISIASGTAISRDRFFELYPGAHLDTRDVITEDCGSGWVEASKALKDILETAISEGVTHVSAKASSLLWNESCCIGVKLMNGREITANSIVLAMGCWTTGFLQQCGIVSDGITCEIAGVTVVGIQLDNNEYEKYKEMPILAVPGEIIPPNSSGIMKINNAISFRAPEISREELQSSLTPGSPYFEENIALLVRFFPELKHAPVAFCRYCFDVVTPAQDFIISVVPDYAGLYLATGGSFHSWKFLPNIGNYVEQLIEGTLSSTWLERWKVGSKPSDQPVHGEIIPRRPFRQYDG